MAASPDQSSEMTEDYSAAVFDGQMLDEIATLEDLMALNITNSNEVKCLLNFLKETYPPLPVPVGVDPISAFCNSTWDGVSCWPTTLAGTTSVLPCVEELDGIKYDTANNSTRVCHPDGVWANKSNYSSCQPLADLGFPSSEYGVDISEYTSIIYFTGYTVSIVALTLAVWIFIHFKDLRCLRNTIHTHLLITYIMADLVWIVTAVLQLYRGGSNEGSCIIVIFLHYFHLTNFFWMFVEGFYLYMLVVETFSADKIRLRIYALIGWGIPLPVVVVWAVVKANWFDYSSKEDGVHQKPGLESFLANCPWMAANSYDWIYMTPAIIVLFVNILFLVKIMWVLITKLRSANSVETQQYRKGSKALLVLIPLLGLTYVLVIAGPTEGAVAVYFSHIRAILISSQGFLVTLFFCFLNTEVRNTVRHHWTRRQTSRWLEHSQNHNSRGRCGTALNSNRDSKDGSRAPCESTRLYSSFPERNHKRDMSFSEVTTVASFAPGSAIHLNNLGPGTNGHPAAGLIAASTRLTNGGTAITAVSRFAHLDQVEDDTNLLVNENRV